jgi:hypothetical protein
MIASSKVRDSKQTFECLRCGNIEERSTDLGYAEIGR